MNAMPDIIDRFRFTHHTVAMMFAAGMTTQEIARRTGYTSRRLNLLWNDPTFQELIEHYKRPHVKKLEQHIADHHEEMESIMAGTLRQVKEHLDESDETGELLKIPYL